MIAIKKFIFNLFKRIRFSRLFAMAMRELPPISCHKLSQPVDRLTSVGWRNRVHLTAQDWLLGRTHFAELSDFISFNKSHVFVIWDDDAINDFMRKNFLGEKIYDAFIEAPYGIIRSDIFRLCVLRIYGGYYFDIKSRFNKPLLECFSDNIKISLIEESSDVTGDCSVVNVANWFFYCEPRHEFIELCIDEVCCTHSSLGTWPETDIANFVWSFAGPRMVTRVWTRASFKFDKNSKLIIPHDGGGFGAVYACKGSWVRKLIRSHYSAM